MMHDQIVFSWTKSFHRPQREKCSHSLIVWTVILRLSGMCLKYGSFLRASISFVIESTCLGFPSGFTCKHTSLIKEFTIIRDINRISVSGEYSGILSPPVLEACSHILVSALRCYMSVHDQWHFWWCKCCSMPSPLPIVMASHNYFLIVRKVGINLSIQSPTYFTAARLHSLHFSTSLYLFGALVSSLNVQWDWWPTSPLLQCLCSTHLG